MDPPTETLEARGLLAVFSSLDQPRCRPALCRDAETVIAAISVRCRARGQSLHVPVSEVPLRPPRLLPGQRRRVGKVSPVVREGLVESETALAPRASACRHHEVRSEG